jgi:hypothetical protein
MASSSSAAAAAVGRAVEEARSALKEHADVSTELRAVDWKVRLLFSPLIPSRPPRIGSTGKYQARCNAGSQCSRENLAEAVISDFSVSHALPVLH